MYNFQNRIKFFDKQIKYFEEVYKSCLLKIYFSQKEVYYQVREMNLLENQLILSSVQMRHLRCDDALNRLVDTQNVYSDNSMVKSNISVAKCVRYLWKQNQQRQSHLIQGYKQIVESLDQSILLAPLNYVGYYNLFNFKIKNHNLTQGLKHLIQSISALYLQKALNEQSQKIVNLVQKQYCADSIIVYLIKAIIHLKHQKYIIAITELNWVVEKTTRLKDKLQTLQLIKLIFQALQQKDKKYQTQLKIQQLNYHINQSIQKHKQSKKQTLSLICTYSLPQQEQDIKLQLSKRLKEFSSLLKQTQHKSLVYSKKTNNILFKQVNSQQLKQHQTNRQSLYLNLKQTIIQSPLYTKSQSKKLTKSQKSQQINNVTSSQNFVINQAKEQKVSLTSRNQQNTNQMRLSFTPNRNNLSPLHSSRDQTDSRRINNSLNFSGVKAKKKTLNIYPLQIIDQQVEIKLVMAQLTNNKQLLGQMDPYCIINYNNSSKQSSVVKGGGKQPRWKEGYIFKLTEQPTQVLIEVYDKQKFFKKDDFVGSGQFILDKNGLIKVQLFQNNTQAGTIFVTVDSKN